MLRTLSISSTIRRNDWLLTILEDENTSSDMTASVAAVAVDEVDNDDDDGGGGSIRSRSKNATLRDKSTLQTDNRMALAGCWNV